MALDQLGAAFKSLKDYAGTFLNASIVLVTGGLQQLTTISVFRCPCVEPSSLGPERNDTSISIACSQLLNHSYGIAFILAPAFALFIFSAASNPILWKSITGCMKRSKKHQERACGTTFTFVTILLQSLISPSTWICIALLDGKYLACSITTLPYRIGENTDFANCDEVSKWKISEQKLWVYRLVWWNT